MKKIVITFICFVTVLAITLIGLSLGTKTLVYTNNITNNVQFIGNFNGSSFDFYNGSTFVAHNAITGLSSPILPLSAFPTVTQVKWSAHGALFQAINYTPSDDLYYLLSQKHLSTTDPYWWVANFDKKTISLVGDPYTNIATVTSISWSQDGSEYLYYATTNGGEGYTGTKELIDVSLASATTKAVVGPSDLGAIVFFNPDHLIYLANDGVNPTLKQFTISNHSITILDKQIVGDVIANAAGTKFAYLRTSVKPAPSETLSGDLVIYTTADKSASTIMKNVSASFNWDEAADTLVSSYLDGRSKQHLALTDAKLKTSHVTIKNLPTAPITLLASAGISPLIAFTSPHGVMGIVHDTADSNYSTASVNNNLKSTGINTSIYSIHYFPDQDSYGIYINQNPYHQNQQKALDYIKSLGDDPYQLNIKWYPMDWVDRNS